MKRIIALIFLLALSRGNSFGQITFEKTFGGPSNENNYSLQQTIDGGYIITGGTFSYGAGLYDVYLIKTDMAGNILWSKTYGNAYKEEGLCVQQTNDMGYIIAGYTDITGTSIRNFYLIKTDSVGNTLWSKTYDGGGSLSETADFIRQTSDGGYIVVGTAASLNCNGFDIYLVKTDGNGNLQWTKRFTELPQHGFRASEVKQTIDGGYIIVGNYNHGGILLIKTNGLGTILWAKTYGGGVNEYGYSVEQTLDNGYIITGSTWSFGASNDDVFLIKTNVSGNLIWSKTFSKGYSDIGYSVKQASNGDYIICGVTSDFVSFLEFDILLTRIDGNGNLLWSKTFGGPGQEGGYAGVQCSNDGGFIIVGNSSSDIFLIKTDSAGNSYCSATDITMLVTTPATIVTNVALTISSSGIAYSFVTQVNAGGFITTPCSVNGVIESTLEENLLFQIFPNPATNQLTISNGQWAIELVEIYDVVGEKVFSQQQTASNKPQTTIDISQLHAGIYFVLVRDEKNNVAVRKFVKM